MKEKNDRLPTSECRTVLATNQTEKNDVPAIQPNDPDFHHDYQLYQHIISHKTNVAELIFL